MKILLLILFVIPAYFSYSQIENGMVGHFPFDGDYNDISTSNIIGINNNCVLTNDRNGTPSLAIDLDGSTSYVSFNDNIVKPSFPLTVSAWVKLDSYPPSSQFIAPIISSDNEYDDYNGYWLAVNTSGNVSMSIGGGLGFPGSTNRRTFLTTGTISVGTWHHILAIIRAYNDMEIHIDCQNMPGTYTGTGPTSIVYTNTETRIGGQTGNPGIPNGQFLDGSIDQVVIWDRELNSSEIAFMCNTNNDLNITELNPNGKELLKIVDLMGRETEDKPNTSLIYIYSDGTTEKVYRME